MSLRVLALELYDMEKRVVELTRALETAGPESRQELELELLLTTAERNRLRAVIQAKKEPSSPGRP